jgi:hypothetical protein
MNDVPVFTSRLTKKVEERFAAASENRKSGAAAKTEHRFLVGHY